jgi:predicted GTPase
VFPPSDHNGPTQGLIIPSLTLPAALRRPTPYGQTLGEVRILLLGRKGAGKTLLSSILLDGNEDVVEVGSWESGDDGEVIRASTYWIEHKDAHGLEKYEPAHNVELTEIAGYEQDSNVCSR